MSDLDKRRVLFVCIHNSARSQMAEAYLNREGGDLFIAESAGLEPGAINPYVTRVLQEEGIDISGKKTNSVFEFFKEGRDFNAVITVCDEASAERCPLFPGKVRRLHWSFPDPSVFSGSEEEILAKTREVRDLIKEKISEFVESYR